MFKLDPPDDLMNLFKELERNSTKIFGEMAEKGAKVCCDRIVRPSLEKAIGSNPKPKKDGELRKSESTGELAASLGASPAKVDREGVINSRIGFAEPRRKQPKTFGGSYQVQTNAMVANVLEHGSQKRGQAARPWLRPVKRKVEQLFKQEAEEVFGEYLK